MTNNDELALKLKAAADSATPGEWRRASTRFNGITATPFSLGGEEKMLANTSEKRDAEFITEANPANILTMLAERDADKALIADQAKRIAELEACVSNLQVNRPVVYGDGFYDGYWKARSEQSMSSEDENHG